ncbi:MAG: DUF1707 domain-containing protein [Actinomycetota bacterium]|nr:DUF1707 domain-containing protein [Actinomycetota bacterium]
MDDAPSAAQDEPNRSVRIGDAERDRCLETLQQHYSAGRLDLPELQDRVERALRARTDADLAALLADLPAAPRLPADRRARGRRPCAVEGLSLRQRLVLAVAGAALTSASGLALAEMASTLP